jgi:uracil-DNA glycosylase
MGMGFCYPGRAPNGGDLPPRPECAPLWHPRLRPQFTAVGLTLLVGGYAIRYYLPQMHREALGAVVARWRDFLPEFFVLPHPSWRTTAWERKNPWFAAEALADLRSRVGALLNPPPRSAPCLRR